MAISVEKRLGVRSPETVMDILREPRVKQAAFDIYDGGGGSDQAANWEAARHILGTIPGAKTSVEIGFSRESGHYATRGRVIVGVRGNGES